MADLNWAEKLIYACCFVAALEFLLICLDNAVDLYEWRFARKGLWWRLLSK
jgi:hypothetical protein